LLIFAIAGPIQTRTILAKVKRNDASI